MCSIMWEAGSPDILSLIHSPSPIINSSAPGGCCCWHTLGLFQRQRPVFTVLHPATWALSSHPLPLPTWYIPSLIYSTKSTAKLSLDSVAFSCPQMGPSFTQILRPDWLVHLATPFHFLHFPNSTQTLALSVPSYLLESSSPG